MELRIALEFCSSGSLSTSKRCAVGRESDSQEGVSQRFADPESQVGFGWLVGWLGWVGLGWVGLGWVGLGWVGLGWVGLGWVGLGWVGLGWVGLGWLVGWLVHPFARMMTRPSIRCRSFPEDSARALELLK